MPPADCHLARRMRHAHASKAAGQVLDQTAPVIVREPILQIMEPRKIFARALTSAITIQLDVMKQPFRRPVFRRFVQHPRECERDLEKRPAIQGIEIDRWRFDAVVDLERVILVADARPSRAPRWPFVRQSEATSNFPLERC